MHSARSNFAMSSGATMKWDGMGSVDATAAGVLDLAAEVEPASPEGRRLASGAEASPDGAVTARGKGSSKLQGTKADS